MVDAGDELDDGGLEGVVCWEGQDEAEDARVVGGAGGGAQGYVPRVDGAVGREGDGEALGGVLGDFAEFLGKSISGGREEKGCG